MQKHYLMKQKIGNIEKDPDFGGRVHTVERDGLKYECGAARFHDSHTKLLTLIDIQRCQEL